jgi:hypothetical protein
MAPRSKWPATIDLNRHLGPVSPDEPKLRIPFKPESGREPLTATQFNQAKRNTAAMSARPDLMRARTIAKQRAADAGPGGHDQEYFYRLARGIPIVQNPPTVVPTPAQLRDAKRWGLDKVEMDRFVRGLPPLGWPQPIINYALLSREEGKQHLDAYPLPGKRDSGATIATGVDLGHQSAARLIRIGVPKELVTRLNEYFGRKGVDAVKYLKENPLSINQDQADILDEKIQSDDLKGLIKIFNDDSKVGEFVELPIAAQSALASLYHHMNRGLKFNQKELWGYLTTGQWQSAVDHLDRMKEYSKRRKNEAKVLKGAIDLGAMPAFSVQK